MSSEHIARAKLLNATIIDVIEICDEQGDKLILAFPGGDAVTISAERLRLAYNHDFEKELADIRNVPKQQGSSNN